MSTTDVTTGIGWYLDRIKSARLLTAQEEKQLARRVREHSDPLARERMIRANLRLVIRIAKEYSNPGMTLSDLVAEGNLGLMRAVEQFDPEAGVRFSTYASWWIKQSIKRAMINASQPIHIPAYLVKLIAKWRRTRRSLEGKLGRPPTAAEMAKAMKISRKKVEIIRQGLQAVNTSGQTGPEGGQALSEMVRDDRTESPDQGLMDASNTPLVRSLLEKLDERQRQILELRFGLTGQTGQHRTYKQIGEVVGLTRERVRQLEKQALAGLKVLAEELL